MHKKLRKVCNGRIREVSIRKERESKEKVENIVGKKWVKFKSGKKYFLLSVDLKFECLITCRMFLSRVLACGPIIALISGGPPQIRLHQNR